MSVIAWIRRDDVEQTTVAVDIPCTIDREQRHIVLTRANKVDPPDIRTGDLASCGDLPSAVVVVGVDKPQDDGPISLTYRLVPTV